MILALSVTAIVIVVLLWEVFMPQIQERWERRQAGAAVRARLVRELDAVLVEEHPGLRQVRHDRLVRIDEVGVLDALSPAPPHADEAEVAVHRPLLVVHA